MNEEIKSRLVWLGGRRSDPEEKIAHTLRKLPEDVREWAIEKLVWFCPPMDIDGEAAIIGPGPMSMERYAEGRSGEDGGFWLSMRVVYIAPHVFIDQTKEEKLRHVIAHEIAHHWLRHSPGIAAEDVDAMEAEAHAYAHKWLKTQPRKGDQQG